jgi:hypothetical protein
MLDASAWDTAKQTFVTNTYIAARDALNKLGAFLNSGPQQFSTWNSGVTNLTWALTPIVVGLAAPELAIAVSAAAVVAGIINQEFANKAGSLTADIIEKLYKAMEAIKNKDLANIEKERLSDQEKLLKAIGSPPGARPNDCCPALEELALEWSARQRPKIPTMNQIYCALLMKMLKANKWKLDYDPWSKSQNLGGPWLAKGYYGTPFAIDPIDLADELNKNKC